MIIRISILCSLFYIFFLIQNANAAEYSNPILDGDLSSIVALTSDYVPRGITQSDEKPALHGSLYYNHDSGGYLSIGGTTIKYDYDKDATVEVDIYSGYKFSYLGFNFDAGLRGYLYPGADRTWNYDFFESRFAVEKDFKLLNITGAVQYSPNYWHHTGNGFYIPVTVTAPLKDAFSLIGKVAHQSVEDNAKFTIPDYWNWSGGIAYSHSQYRASLEYMDSDLHKSEFSDGADPRFVLTLMRFF